MLTKLPISTSAYTLHTIVNAVPIPIFVKDRRHRLIIVNDALCELRGRSRSEMLGGSDQFLPQGQRDVFWRKDDEVFATGQPNENEEVLTDASGSPRVIITHKRLITLPTPDGEQSFILGTISDVTRFREAEAQVRYFAWAHGATPQNAEHQERDTSGDQQAFSSWDIEAALRDAVATEQISLVFQPLVAAADGALRGFEALARWRHPIHGNIPPEVFIPIAERSGLIILLGGDMLHKACSAAAAWPWPVRVAVNVSPAQLAQGDFLGTVRSALAKSGLPAAQLELEVTESALVNSSTRSTTLFSQLKALGVSLTLDDFGTGWSSLATLRQFDFDRVKIDRSFIVNLETDTRSVAIVRAVLNLGQMLGVPVTAEGIEAQGQLLALRQMQCAELQGHYLGAPQPEVGLPDQSSWQDVP